MKHLVGLILGALLAVAIGCASAPQKSSAPPQATAAGAEPPPGTLPPGAPPRSEIDALDAQITADMASLGIARPTAPPLACTGAACVEQLSGAATIAVAPAPPTCKPAQTQTCSDVCGLKDAICKSAGRICQLASDLGGTDDHANDRCTQGTASCDAAKQRCCGCL